MRSIRSWYFLTILILLGSCSSSLPPLDKTFRIVWENSPRSIDPRYSIDADSQYLGDFIHCSLLTSDEHGNLKNNLASEIKWVDSQTLQISLRPSVQFSNQKPVTAEDVKATFDFFLKDTPEPSPLKATLTSLKSIEVLSSDRLRFHLVAPDSDFLYSLVIGILPREQAEGSKIIDSKQIIGCGNFKIDEWASTHIQLKRRSDVPSKAVQFIRIEFIKDENTRLLKLKNSEADLVQNSISRDQLVKIKEYKNLRLLKSSGLNITYLAFQLADPILQNKKVREALALSINRNKIIKHIFHGWASPASSILIPSDPYYNHHLKPTEYNPEKAKQLLDEAGYPMKGQEHKDPRFTLKLSTTTSSARILVAQAIAEEFHNIGITLQIDSTDWGKFKSNIDRGAAQMWNLNWLGFKGPDILRYVFASKSTPPHGANRGHYSNSELDHILDLAKKEMNFDRRKALYDRAQVLIAKDLPYIFLWHEEQFAIIHSRIHNYVLYSDGRLSSVENATFSPP